MMATQYEVARDKTYWTYAFKGLYITLKRAHRSDFIRLPVMLLGRGPVALVL